MGVRRSLLALALMVGLFAANGEAQTQLPEGTGKEETVRLCSTCHPPERGAAVRLTRDGWKDVISKMVALGAKGTDEELGAVLDYLSTNFKGEAARPLNLNAATAVELESIVGLLRKEAQTWIAHRAKTPCKTPNDLKKIAGIDFRKIDARRDRLVCF